MTRRSPDPKVEKLARALCRRSRKHYGTEAWSDLRAYWQDAHRADARYILRRERAAFDKAYRLGCYHGRLERHDDNGGIDRRAHIKQARP